MSGDTAAARKYWPAVERGARFLDSLRHERMTEVYRAPDSLIFYGLLPPSISHEGYSAKPVHSYWDDFLALRGLKDATELAHAVRTKRHGDLAFFNNLATRDGSVVHLGDNTTGKGEGDDEVITVDLGRVYAKVDSILFLVSSYQGHTLEWIRNAYCRLVDENDVELARFTLTGGVPQTGMVMAMLVRGSDHWTLRAMGQGIPAKIPSESIEALKPFL